MHEDLPSWPELRETIGADVPGVAEALECSIETLPEYLTVGDRPRFRARITNRHAKPVQLVWLLDGSHLDRFPRMRFAYEGPSGEFEPIRHSRCGNRNTMTTDDFVEVGPGQALDLFADDGFIEQGIKFHEPGPYIARFEYSTAEDDLRKWLGDYWEDTLPDDFRARFRRVPRVVLRAQCAFEVRPRQPAGR